MGYEDALRAAGAEVIEFVEFGSYQGEWLALVSRNGIIGVFEGYYGSCSYCDAFEGELGDCDRDAPDFESRLADFGEGYFPANTISEMLEKIKFDSERLEYDDDYSDMLKKVLEWREKYGQAA